MAKVLSRWFQNRLFLRLGHLLKKLGQNWNMIRWYNCTHRYGIQLIDVNCFGFLITEIVIRVGLELASSQSNCMEMCSLLLTSF